MLNLSISRPDFEKFLSFFDDFDLKKRLRVLGVEVLYNERFSAFSPRIPFENSLKKGYLLSCCAPQGNTGVVNNLLITCQ